MGYKLSGGAIITIHEALGLLALIERDAQTGPVRIHQIGNFEHVIIIKARGYYLWSYQDYKAYLDMKEREQAAKREAKKQSRELAAVS